MTFGTIASLVVAVLCYAGASIVQIQGAKAKHRSRAEVRLSIISITLLTLVSIISILFGAGIIQIAGVLTGFVVFGFVAFKVGGLIWVAALLPALKAIPAALSGYYVKKWLDDRSKKKTPPSAEPETTPTSQEPEKTLPAPTPETPPTAPKRTRAPEAEPAPIKRTRKRATSATPSESPTPPNQSI